MRHTMVSYTVKPGREEENATLVRGVFEELAREQPDGLRYAVFFLPDTRQFIHLYTDEGSEAARDIHFEAGEIAVGTADRKSRIVGPQPDTQRVVAHDPDQRIGRLRALGCRRCPGLVQHAGRRGQGKDGIRVGVRPRRRARKNNAEGGDQQAGEKPDHDPSGWPGETYFDDQHIDELVAPDADYAGTHIAFPDVWLQPGRLHRVQRHRG